MLELLEKKGLATNAFGASPYMSYLLCRVCQLLNVLEDSQIQVHILDILLEEFFHIEVTIKRDATRRSSLNKM